MNSDLLVVVLSLVMLVGSFGIGLLPALIKASNRLMNLISILGAGLLVGVALIIIIPEGMITLNEALNLPAEPIDAKVASVLLKETDLSLEDITRLHMPSGDSSGPNISMYLGGSLIFGFLVMLLIDQVFAILKERLSSHPEDHEGEYHNLDEQEAHINRISCKHVQNSVQSIHNEKNRRGMRSGSQYVYSPPRMLSDDYTQPSKDILI